MIENFLLSGMLQTLTQDVAKLENRKKKRNKSMADASSVQGAEIKF
jgi:hypothetical protein